MKQKRPQTIVYDRNRDRHIINTVDDTIEVREGNIKIGVDKQGNKVFDVAVKGVNIVNVSRVCGYSLLASGDTVIHQIEFSNGETAILNFRGKELIGFQTTCPIMIGQDGILELHDVRRPV